MNAIILAAGKGERINNITSSIPKPMIEVNGKPILQYNIELCKSYGILNIFINVHHLSDKIMDYFGDGSKFGVSIIYSIEDNLNGTSGAVRQIVEKIWNGNINFTKQINMPFFIIYGDNISNYNLSNLEQKALETNADIIIGFHYREDTSSSGVAEFDKNGKILKFIEKPKPGESNSHWVNAGIYYAKPAILKFIPDNYSDFGKDIFPDLLRKGIPMYGVYEKIEVKAFDTYEMITKNKN
jgi:NDP-sugar pyrophosphorylase family protein